MTREEAIYTLEQMKTWSKDLSDDEIEALVMAIKALKHMDVLDRLVEDIQALPNGNPSYWHCADVVNRAYLLEIIDQYRKEEDL